ncbi:hypothetical protein [Sphingomonas sp. ERG5]|uniref:hypothetical protein n=1 Tax=Sphingomonas sp. ERG5 TaxID=1381597 RepID=UPI00126A78BD|nr:hypothetical protein [Sphingomonas sp. ERG5]
MSEAEVDEFAENLIKTVRDRAINSFDGILEKNMRSETTRRYVQEFGEKLESSIFNVIPDVVDTTIFYLLNAIDNGDLRLLYKNAEGEVVDLDAKGFGEMAGRYVEEDAEGWRQRFSRSRIL